MLFDKWFKLHVGDNISINQHEVRLDESFAIDIPESITERTTIFTYNYVDLTWTCLPTPFRLPAKKKTIMCI